MSPPLRYEAPPSPVASLLGSESSEEENDDIDGSLTSDNEGSLTHSPTLTRFDERDVALEMDKEEWFLDDDEEESGSQMPDSSGEDND